MKVQTLTGHADGVKCVVISPDGHILVSAGEDGKIKFWQLNSGEAYHTLSGHQYGVKNSDKKNSVRNNRFSDKKNSVRSNRFSDFPQDLYR